MPGSMLILTWVGIVFVIILHHRFSKVEQKTTDLSEATIKTFI
jgi:hypothetical protein